MKVKMFEGTSLDIETQINEWLKESQPKEVEYEMTYDGDDNGVKVHTVLANYAPSSAEKD